MGSKREGGWWYELILGGFGSGGGGCRWLLLVGAVKKRDGHS